MDPTQETTLSGDGGSGQEPTSTDNHDEPVTEESETHEGTNDEELRTMFNEAKQVSIDKDRERRRARAEVKQHEDVWRSLVEENHDVLHNVYERDERLADQIAKKAFGKSYAEWKAQGGKDDIRSLIREELSASKQAQETASLEEYRNELFRNTGYKPDHMRRVIQKYESFGPAANKAQVELFFKAATGQEVVSRENKGVPSVSVGRSSSRGDKKVEITDGERRYIQYNGMSEEEFLKLKKVNLNHRR